MDNLSSFDTMWVLISEPKKEEHLEMAIEISLFKRGKTSEVSPQTEDVLYIHKRPLRKLFIETMLFAEIELEFISKHSGMSEDIIEAYKAIFFDTDKLRGSIGFTEYIEDLLDMPVDTGLYEFGEILREARYGGKAIILEQFNISLDSEDVDERKKMLAQQAIWDIRNARRDGTFEEVRHKLAATKDVMKIIADSASSTSSKQSSTESLVAAIKELNQPGLGEGTVQLPTFNRDTGDYIEVSLEEE